MTQEEKQLLLIDLSARLFYGVKVCARFNTGNRYTANVTGICEDRDYIQIRENVLHPYTGSSIEDIRPYLRPMSSMTEEEILEFSKIVEIDVIVGTEKVTSATLSVDAIDWLNAHHFDYRIDPFTGKTLIESGLALEALEGMYKTE